MQLISSSDGPLARLDLSAYWLGVDVLVTNGELLRMDPVPFMVREVLMGEDTADLDDPLSPRDNEPRDDFNCLVNELISPSNSLIPETAKEEDF